MAYITIIKPTDQPEGKNRLLAELENNLQNENYNYFAFIVAFAKLSPLLKLNDKIVEWRKKKTINAIFGVDQKGTSQEALQFALNNFNDTYVIHVIGKFSPTFHPKIYLFKGDKNAMAYVGSNNLTVGGTETNFESYVKIEMNLPEDDAILKEVEDSWDKCQESSIKLDEKYYKQLISSDLVISEKEMKQTAKAIKAKAEKKVEKEDDLINFPKFKIKPPAPLPKNLLLKGVSKEVTKIKEDKTTEIIQEREDVPVSTLLMHIIPHHNGEVLLSINAVKQNWDFFGWPFTGNTVPKKAENPSYPQREPDPIVDIYLFNEKEEEIFSVKKFGLNTVYYESRSELRITVPINIFENSKGYVDGPYPILVIKNEDIDADLDYEMQIFLPGSDQYIEFEAACNQVMPSGGKKIARKFGWL